MDHVAVAVVLDTGREVLHQGAVGHHNRVGLDHLSGGRLGGNAHEVPGDVVLEVKCATAIHVIGVGNGHRGVRAHVVAPVLQAVGVRVVAGGSVRGVAVCVEHRPKEHVHATRLIDEDITGTVGIEEHGVATAIHRIGDGGVEQGAGVEHVVVDREVDDGLVAPAGSVVLGNHRKRVIEAVEHGKGDRLTLGVDGVGVGHEATGEGGRVELGKRLHVPVGAAVRGPHVDQGTVLSVVEDTAIALRGRDADGVDGVAVGTAHGGAGPEVPDVVAGLIRQGGQRVGGPGAGPYGVAGGEDEASGAGVAQRELGTVGQVPERRPADADVLDAVVGNLSPVHVRTRGLVVVSGSPVAEGRRLEGLDPAGADAVA